MTSLATRIITWPIVVAVFLLACNVGYSDPEEAQTLTPAADKHSVDPLPTQFAITRFADFAEVETVYGFDAPEPKGGHYTRTHLSAQEIRPGAFVVHAIYWTGSDSIYVDLVGPQFWPDGPARRTEPRTIGETDGWIISRDGDRGEFAFACSAAPAGTVWCVVKGRMDEVDQFVSSLQSDEID